MFVFSLRVFEVEVFEASITILLFHTHHAHETFIYLYQNMFILKYFVFTEFINKFFQYHAMSLCISCFTSASQLMVEFSNADLAFDCQLLS